MKYEKAMVTIIELTEDIVTSSYECNTQGSSYEVATQQDLYTPLIAMKVITLTKVNAIRMVIFMQLGPDVLLSLRAQYRMRSNRYLF